MPLALDVSALLLYVVVVTARTTTAPVAKALANHPQRLGALPHLNPQGVYRPRSRAEFAVVMGRGFWPGRSGAWFGHWQQNRRDACLVRAGRMCAPRLPGQAGLPGPRAA